MLKPLYSFLYAVPCSFTLPFTYKACTLQPPWSTCLLFETNMQQHPLHHFGSMVSCNRQVEWKTSWSILKKGSLKIYISLSANNFSHVPASSLGCIHCLAMQLGNFSAGMKKKTHTHQKTSAYIRQHLGALING